LRGIAHFVIISPPFSEPAKMPIQPAGAEGAAGTAEIFEEKF